MAARPSRTTRLPQQKVANAFVNNFNDPIQITEAFHDEGKAKKVVMDAFGSSTWPVVKGKARIGRGQVRQKLGMSAAILECE